MTAAIYARVSTVGKGQDTENQVSQMRAWAAVAGHEIVDLYVDHTSGAKASRPEFERMMVDAAAGRFTMLLFWSLDRLSREGVLQTLLHLRRLDDAGCCWRSHTEAYLDSCGVFREAVLAILAAVAKQERLRISERVKAGLETARAKGRVGGRRHVVRDPGVMAQVVALRGQLYSVSQIAQSIGTSPRTVNRMLAEAPAASAGGA